MPTYVYACTSCGKHLEVVQSMKDEPLTECAECGGRLRKVFSPIGIVFKGSGFYKTDSRTSNGRKSGSPTPAKDTAAKDSGGDSTPAAKPATDSGSSASSDKGSSGSSTGGTAQSA
jgi:putative FmdB family regulatory protein